MERILNVRIEWKANKMKDNKCVWKKETLGMPLKRSQECVADAFS